MDLNPEPTPYRGVALPLSYKGMVGPVGVEPTNKLVLSEPQLPPLLGKRRARSPVTIYCRLTGPDDQQKPTTRSWLPLQKRPSGWLRPSLNGCHTREAGNNAVRSGRFSRYPCQPPKPSMQPVPPPVLMKPGFPSVMSASICRETRPRVGRSW